MASVQASGSEALLPIGQPTISTGLRTQTCSGSVLLNGSSGTPVTRTAADAIGLHHATHIAGPSILREGTGDHRGEGEASAHHTLAVHWWAPYSRCSGGHRRECRRPAPGRTLPIRGAAPPRRSASAPRRETSPAVVFRVAAAVPSEVGRGSRGRRSCRPPAMRVTRQLMTGEKAAAATPDSAISALMSSVRDSALER